MDNPPSMTSDLWPELRKHLEGHLDPDDFATWVRPLSVQSSSDEELVLVAPSDRFRTALEAAHRETLQRALAEVAGGKRRLTIAVQPTLPQPTTQSGAADGQFNPRYVFDSFVVGSSNQFSYAAARAVAENPFNSYNPLFLYGGVGLGKTHLLHATGHLIAKRNPHLRILYLPAEQFVNELISSLRFNRMPTFRERYRSIDILLVDDIQFLANKERTQEEFFHTFNTLYTRGKQIILTSDSSPRQIPTLEERLRSRFEWGLIADLQPPDLETKVAILRRKAETAGVELPGDVALFIARQVRSNVRELEGHLNRVVAFSSLTGNPLSLELAKETLKDILPQDDHRQIAGEIVRMVARHYGLKVTEIKSKSNSRQIAFPRQVAMYLCRHLTDLSFPEIGKLFGGKHHTTVMHAVDRIDSERDRDPDFARTLEQFLRHFA